MAYDARLAGSKMIFRENGECDMLFLDAIHLPDKGYLLIASINDKVGAISLSSEEGIDTRTIKKVAKEISVEKVKEVLSKIDEEMADDDINDFIIQLTEPVLKRGK